MASMCYVIRGGPVPEVALMAQGLMLRVMVLHRMRDQVQRHTVPRP